MKKQESKKIFFLSAPVAAYIFVLSLLVLIRVNSRVFVIKKGSGFSQCLRGFPVGLRWSCGFCLLQRYPLLTAIGHVGHVGCYGGAVTYVYGGVWLFAAADAVDEVGHVVLFRGVAG